MADQVIPNNLSADEVVVCVHFGINSHPNDNIHMGDLATPQSTVVVGHGSAGTITAVGSSVTGLQPGDNVAIEVLLSWQHVPCEAQECSSCASTDHAAITAHNSTPLAYLFKENACTKLPEPLTLLNGALVEPLAIAINLVRKAKMAKGKLIVFGANFIGILCCILARSEGATDIMIVDIDSRLSDAVNFVGTETSRRSHPTPEESAEKARALFPKASADVAINASGDEVFLETAKYALVGEGRYIQAGVRPSDISFDVLELFEKINTEGNIGYTHGDFGSAVNLMLCGEVSQVMESFRPQ